MANQSARRPKKGYEDPSISGKIQLLNKTYRVFAANHEEIKRELESLENPAKTLLIWQDEEKLETEELHIVRLLHNYSASAKTLIDHTRILTDELYENTDFADEYNTNKNGFFVDVPVAQFVQKLRNYTLHRALPFAKSTLRFRGGHCSISLSAIELRLWDGWNVKALEYLDSVGESVRVDEIVHAYTAIVREFYAWFYKRQNEIHFEW